MKSELSNHDAHHHVVGRLELVEVRQCRLPPPGFICEVRSCTATAVSGYKQSHFEASSSDKFIDCLLMCRAPVVILGMVKVHDRCLECIVSMKIMYNQHQSISFILPSDVI